MDHAKAEIKELSASEANHREWRQEVLIGGSIFVAISLLKVGLLIMYIRCLFKGISFPGW